jgi:hypothetical protein
MVIYFPLYIPPCMQRRLGQKQKYKHIFTLVIVVQHSWNMYCRDFLGQLSNEV